MPEYVFNVQLSYKRLTPAYIHGDKKEKMLSAMTQIDADFTGTDCQLSTVSGRMVLTKQ